MQTACSIVLTVTWRHKLLQILLPFNLVLYKGNFKPVLKLQSLGFIPNSGGFLLLVLSVKLLDGLMVSSHRVTSLLINIYHQNLYCFWHSHSLFQMKSFLLRRTSKVSLCSYNLPLPLVKMSLLLLWIWVCRYLSISLLVQNISLQSSQIYSPYVEPMYYG